MHRLLVAGLAILLVISLAAAENESIAEIFPGGEGITPPSLEDEPTEPLVARDGADDKAEVPVAVDGLKALMLEIRDVNTGQLITNAHIRIILNDGSDITDTLRFVGDTGVMELQLRPGSWDISLKLDITDTSGKDYYYDATISLTDNTTSTAYMQPVGSLMGEVYDPNSNLLPGATIKLECSGEYGETASVSTDLFGSFSADWLPIGSCKVSALSGNKVGSQTVQISQGQLVEVNITLEQSVAGGGDDYILFIIILMVVVVVLAFFMLKKKPVRTAAPKTERGPITADRHMEDILSALDINERRIVKALMEGGGKSMQYKLGRELDLPKSSMSRAVSGLESRNIVKTEKLGRIKRVELSQWFLNSKKS